MSVDAEIEALDREENQCLRERDRAVRARNIIEDEVYGDAWDKVHAELRRRLEEAPIGSLEEVEDIRRCMKLLRETRKVLDRCMETGKLADAQLAAIEEKRSRLNFFRKRRRVA